jgi:hypothetical protein
VVECSTGIECILITGGFSMREDFYISINLRKGIYVDRNGRQYILKEIVKNIENFEDYVVLTSIDDGNTYICSIEHFVSPFVDEDENLVSRFRMKKLFEGEEYEDSKI